MTSQVVGSRPCSSRSASQAALAASKRPRPVSPRRRLASALPMPVARSSRSSARRSGQVRVNRSRSSTGSRKPAATIASPKSAMGSSGIGCGGSCSPVKAACSSPRVSGPKLEHSSRPPGRSTRRRPANTPGRFSIQASDRLANTRSTLPSASGSARASAHSRGNGRHQPACRRDSRSIGSDRSSASTCDFGQRFFIAAAAWPVPLPRSSTTAGTVSSR